METTQNLLLLIKLDAQNLLERLEVRQKEFIEIFAAKRDRSHFKHVFFNRYQALPLSELKLCPEEVIILADAYYKKVSDLQWYLEHTQDMPAAIEDHVIRELALLRESFLELSLTL